jgi:hypothetical protein
MLMCYDAGRDIYRIARLFVSVTLPAACAGARWSNLARFLLGWRSDG